MKWRASTVADASREKNIRRLPVQWNLHVYHEKYDGLNAILAAEAIERG